MPRLNRREIVPENQVGVFHCIQRCVRRAFLCGFDHATQKNFDHRKLWVQNRLRQLASLFGVDVCGYAVMSNHLHVILRTRPDLVAAWSNKEVAKRWWTLFTGSCGRELWGVVGHPHTAGLRFLLKGLGSGRRYWREAPPATPLRSTNQRGKLRV